LKEFNRDLYIRISYHMVLVILVGHAMVISQTHRTALWQSKGM